MVNEDCLPSLRLLKYFHVYIRCIRTLEAHMDVVLALAGSESSVYSGSADRSIRLWSCRRPNGTPRTLSNDSNGTSSPLPHHHQNHQNHHPQSPANLPRSPSMTHSSPSMTSSRHGSLGKLDAPIFTLEHAWEEHDEQVIFVHRRGLGKTT